VEDVQGSERSQAVARRVTSAQNALDAAGARKAFREFPEIIKFLKQFECVHFRRSVLAIIGGTNLGKSELAGHVVSLAGEKNGAEGLLEVTVENNDQLDLSQFTDQAGVVFDGVGDAMTLKNNREILQGRAKVCQGGKSATMMYAYDFTLHNRAVVATFDLSAKGLSLFDTDHWLSNEKNVIVLRLTQPAWEDGLSHALHKPLDPHEEMRTWSVRDLVRWLESCDLAGPAEAFHQNGVAGCDFLGFASAVSLQQELRLTPFCARKLICLRDRFLDK